MLEIRKVARRTKSCSKSEKLLKSCRATSGQPYATIMDQKTAQPLVNTSLQLS